MANPTVAVTDPTFLQSKSYNAQADRKFALDTISEGVVGVNDQLVSLTTLLGISIAAGTSHVKGGNVADQGMYRVYEPSAKTLTATAAHATLPRIDQVVVRVDDSAHDSSGAQQAYYQILDGTPTSGATLSNRTGAVDLNALSNSKTVILLADLWVRATLTTFTGGDLADRRSRARVGSGLAMSALPTYGTVLPTSPGHEDQFILVDNVTNPTYQWLFRYNANNSTAYKWEFLGGPPVFKEAQWMGAEEATASTTYVDLTTPGPIFTVPAAGVYRLHLQAHVRAGGSGTAQNMFITPKLGAAAINEGDGIWFEGHQNATSELQGFRQVTMTAIGDIKCQYRTANASYSASYRNRQMTVWPVRVG